METKIERIGYKKEKERDIKAQAKRCLEGYMNVYDMSKDLGTQLFADAPTLYLNPTERLHIANIINPNEAFATVLASGDFAIEASFHGAKKILTFDINKNQYYPAALKIKALQNMDMNEFYNFFMNEKSKQHLSPELYTELKKRSESDPRLYAFLDEIFNQKKQDLQYQRVYFNRMSQEKKSLLEMMGIDIENLSPYMMDRVFNNLFGDYKNSTLNRTITGQGGVVTEGTYMEYVVPYMTAQEKIKDTSISFLKTDATNLKTSLEKENTDFDRFSAIYLSNVPEYLNKDVFMKAVKEELMPLLTDNGVLAFCVQATDIKRLNMSDDELAKVKASTAYMSDAPELLITHQLINSTESLRTLREEYNVDLEEIETLTELNGQDEKDTFVYVKKK